MRFLKVKGFETEHDLSYTKAESNALIAAHHALFNRVFGLCPGLGKYYQCLEFIIISATHECEWYSLAAKTAPASMATGVCLWACSWLWRSANNQDLLLLTPETRIGSYARDLRHIEDINITSHGSAHGIRVRTAISGWDLTFTMNVQTDAEVEIHQLPAYRCV